MELLEQIETYLVRTKTPPSKFGRMAVGDPRFVETLGSSRTCVRAVSRGVERKSG